MGLEHIPPPNLPTLSNLGVSLPTLSPTDASSIASNWLSAIERAAASGDTSTLEPLFLEDSWWRDMLSLTWDFRTFHTRPKILKFLADQLPIIKPSSFKLKPQAEGGLDAGLQQLYPDLAWISAVFSFETPFGIGFGIVRLVPLPTGEWKAWSVFTNLEGLKGHPEKIGALRNSEPNRERWADQRRLTAEYVNSDPTVLIVGGGQSGLEVAARLKYLDVSALIIEKNKRIGDNWRNRYDALCLHDPVWYDHMPYLPFPPTWPVYPPAGKLANWLENYADSLELDIWTSATVVSAQQDSKTNKWKVLVRREDGREREFTVNHVVFATGLGAGEPKIPAIAGADKFKGPMFHSTQHKKATDHSGKKVVVIGACTSAHDISEDFYRHGVDVTMYQRGSTYVMTVKNGWKIIMEGLYSEVALPTDLADRFNVSFPHFMNVGLAQRSTKRVADADRELLEALNRRGFKTNLGIQGTGFGLLAWQHAGGYYLDTGASQLIVDGKIKLKTGSEIKEFDENGLKFEDGSRLDADVVIFATGVGDSRAVVRRVCGEETFKKLKPMWGLDQEGEIHGIYRNMGVPGLWSILGNLMMCRFHSKHIALQIKAIEEGQFGKRYEA